MQVGPPLRGTRVGVVPRHAPLCDLVNAYQASPEAFRRQFGRPPQDQGMVLALAESALAHGFSSYFDVHLLEDDTVIGHLRVDWSLHEEGLICLHGGSPLDDPNSPGHRRRAQARAREEAWRLMVRAALATPGVQRVGTATAASNRAAQAFIAASGFRRTRVLHLPDGREPQIHYRLVRDWLAPDEVTTTDRSAGLAAWRPQATSAPELTVPASESPETVPTPAGWHRLQEADAAPWVQATPIALLQQLADAPPALTSREDLMQTLFFEAAHGTQFFGHPAPGTSEPARALIAVKPLPGRPGWWMLRGGPLQPQQAPPSLRPWLDACFERCALRRVEAHVSTGASPALTWWRACGLSEEGATEIDRQGQPLATALARVAP